MVSLGWVPAVGLVPFWFVDWPPYVGGQGEPRERGDCSRLLGASFKKQGNLQGGCRMSRSPHLPTRIIKVNMEASTGFSHVFGSVGLDNSGLLP